MTSMKASIFAIENASEAAPCAASLIRTIQGLVFDDSDGHGQPAAGQRGLPHVVVSDGLSLAQTDDQGRYRLDIPAAQTNGFIFVVTPAGYKAGADGYYRLLTEDSAGRDLDFGLIPAPERGRADFSFIQITDSHMGSDVLTSADLNRDLKDCAALKPTFIMATGDMTDNYQHKQFEAFQKSCATIPIPVFPCVGNHDVPFYKKYFGPTYYAFDAGLAHFIVLDSSCGWDAFPRQMEWLKRDLELQPPNKTIFVFQHIPPPDAKVLGGGNLSLMEYLALYNVKGLFTGHFHASRVFRYTDNMLYVSTPALSFSDMMVDPRGLMHVTVKGSEVSLDARHTGCKQALTLVYPAEGSILPPGPVSLLVNAYDTITPSPKVTVQLDQGASRAMTPFGKWNWQDRQDLAAGPHTLKVQAVWDSGATSETHCRFSVSSTPLNPPKPGGNWPMFKGNPERTGTSRESITLPLRLAWAMPLGGTITLSSPVVANGKVFTGVGDESLGGHAGVATLDARTGMRLWFHPSAASIKHTVAVSTNRVYAVNVMGEVIALDAETGAPVWEFQLERAAVERSWPFFAPLVVNGIVYTGVAGHFVALDAATGKPVWRTTAKLSADGAGSSSPADGGDRVIAAFLRGSGISAFDKADGTSLWNQPPFIFNLATPAVSISDGRVYQAACLWKGACSLYAMDLASGKVLWSFDVVNRWPRYQPASSPALALGNVFVGSPDGKLWCVDAKDGTPVWSTPLGRPTAAFSTHFREDNPVISSPVVSGNTVFVGDLNGRFYAIEAKDGHVAWSYDIGTPIMSSPAVSGNMVFISALDGSVYAFVETAGRSIAEPSKAK